MNRPGQPQQRAPNLTANPALSSQFRQAYPGYGMPPRNVLQQAGSGYVPTIQPNTHRTTTQQNQVPTLSSQSSQGFNPPRGQGNYTFGPGVLGQHQPSSVLQQQQQQQPPPSQQQQQQQPPQTNGAQSTLSSLMAQTSGMGATPAASSAAEVSLDPNDFPALGSTPTNTSSINNNGTGQPTTTSYASQAGTGMLLGGTGGSGNAAGSSLTGAQTRDFTPDDFPALGGQAPSNQTRDSLQNQLSGQENLSHPPGLNGFPPSEQQQQLRQNMIGNLQQGTPGMLNLGPTQSRNIHPGFQVQSEAEKQQQRNNYSLKLSQASHAAWGSPNVNPNTQTQPSGVVAGSNGAFSQNEATHTPGTTATTNAPTAGGPPPLSSNGLGNVESHPNTSIPNPNGSSNPIPTTTASVNPTSLPTNPSRLQHPQTPAQQVLISAADRWGLLSLIAMMRNASADADHGLSSIGTDLGTMGLDMSFPGNLYSTFITPWADQSAARTVEPDFHLPACYLSVQAPPPGPTKANMFSDETLFFMFYSSPRDALQEVAAQELWNRNWRYHKGLRLWITKETGTSPSQKVQGGGGEQGSYTIWEPENWAKEPRNLTVLYSDLEEKSHPAFVNTAGLVLANNQSQAQVTQQPTQMAAQPQLPSRGPAFQMGMAGL
ncbi:General negative regulator of transcription subunit 2 [Psilocybe cubensis]|uniref:General negative regulator of transcription subunit 2 n=2 Tax=Psilocybe cubensis TaxID=181762 RepID=A0ACB8GXL5_PSICU|nr:General negative regulator of transcription subunit 2 [Psilocybe cubensis]KAH9480383.1 General negative regulator of transcription subunit 2 [Psilocybe cubensis]